MSYDPRSIARPLLVAPLIVTMAWFYFAQGITESAARGISIATGLGEYQPLLAVLFAFFLTAVGFAAVEWVSARKLSLHKLLALPDRPTWPREWALGAAVGWGTALVPLLLMLLAGALWPQFWFTGRSLWLTLMALLTLAIGTYLEEFVFRGYPFRLLIDCVGPTVATLLMSFAFALFHMVGSSDSTTLSFLGSFLLGLLLSVGYLRTHALWLPWGLHFAWAASTGVLFGLPVQGRGDFATLLEMRAIGTTWLTGGSYGPLGSLVGLLALAGASIVLIRITRDYAWNYTHAPIVAAGYPMEAKPPAAHEAMEREAQAKLSALVQILPTTPGSSSVSTPPGDSTQSATPDTH